MRLTPSPLPHGSGYRLWCGALTSSFAILAPYPGRVLDLARRYWAVALYVSLAGSLVAWISYEAFTTRLITYSQGADYWEHSAVLRALIESPFSPGNPHLVSPALSARYHPVFLAVALVGRALGLDALGAMGLAAGLNMALFSAGVFWFFATYFRDLRAPLYGLLVLTTSWWKGWHFSNVYQLQILPSVASYPSMTAIALSFFCFAAVVSIVRVGPSHLRLLGLALLASLVLIVHPLTATLAYCGMFWIALLEPASSRRARVATLLSLILALALAHFWPYYSPFEVLSGRQGRLEGWIEKAVASVASGGEGPEQPLFYQTRGLRDAIGLAAPGLFFSLLLLWQRKHLFVPLGLACMLGVFLLNMTIPLPLGHRFVLLALVFLHVATVWGWLKLTPGYHEAWGFVSRPWPGLVASTLLLVLLSAGLWHNLELARSRVTQVSGQRLSPVLNYARQVGRRAGPDAIVLGTARDSWPVPTFGPKVVALLHANPLVPDDLDRFGDCTAFFSREASEAQRDAILAKYHVTHVLAGSNSPRSVRSYLAKHGQSQRLAGGYQLYTLRSTP